jgi:hypothetical protein
MKSVQTGLRAEPLFIIALNPSGRVLMTRNMELIRKVIAEIQSRADLAPRRLEVPGYDEVTVERHLEMLVDAGLVEGTMIRQIDVSYPLVMVTDLSWIGHDFAAALANESVWQKIKQSLSAKELATIPLIVIKDVGIELLAKYTKSKLGL